MKDFASVEEAIKRGAIKCSHSSDIANSVIQIKYLGCNQIDFYTCNWLFTLRNIGINKLFEIKNWVDNMVDLGRTARIWIKREDRARNGYSLGISGIGEDGRCTWCRSFFTLLRKKAKDEGFSVEENWICPFEEPISPKNRYGENIRRLMRLYR
jgi:hypothetical protein